MKAVAHVALAVAVIILVAGLVSARTIGEIIDDTRIAGEVKARLTAESLSNFVKIEVATDSGIVTLSGTVDTPDRRARAAQIASAVSGVKGLVNNIQVEGTAPSPSASPAPPPPAPPPASSAPPRSAPPDRAEVAGTVASVNPVAGTITLTDGRVFRVPTGTVWQPVPLADVQPGRFVIVRHARSLDSPAPSASPR
ncbi:MAG TPA: BON domain-containing protein [Methylomirabilota bacterium]|nr:BON domain-containing protein [Methylomirabilota bacterium]